MHKNQNIKNVFYVARQNVPLTRQTQFFLSGANLVVKVLTYL